VSCEELDCGELGCLAGEAGQDARCGEPCDQGQLFNGERCVPCPRCDRPERGEDGPEDRATLAGDCICRTAPGFFYSVGNEQGVVPCDADGDGWVRESARVPLDSGDPVLEDNVRCGLRTIGRIVLHNEEGQTRTVELDEEVPLFESVRNDDDRVLELQWERAQLPRGYWGEDGQGVRARALNRFTKLCHHPRVDYNDNGLPDAYEGANAELPEDYPPDQGPLSVYSYFLELHRGWFEPGAGGDIGGGAWHIEERPRATPEEFGLRYDTGEGCPEALDGCTGWRHCSRLRDPAADAGQPALGFDLATEAGALPDGPGWRGMTHHSQFKCVVVTDVPSPQQPLERSPTNAGRDFLLSACTTTGPPADGPDDRGLQLACGPPEGGPRPGQAYWGMVPYVTYPPSVTHAGYRGGCTNGCAEAQAAWAAEPEDLRCPGLQHNTPLCRDEIADWGRLVCLERLCDEVDNDGDGDVDEQPPDRSEPCATGLEPTCCHTEQLGQCGLGTLISCGDDGDGEVCEPLSPGPERCDALDNDCDGEVDEGTDGVPCAAASATLDLPADPTLEGVCGDRVTVCLGGHLDCVPRALAAYQPEGETLCDGLDNDCDGLTDEDLLGSVTGDEAGTLFGSPCVDAQAQGLCVQQIWACVDGAATCAPTDERVRPEEACTSTNQRCHWLCDGLDNDCDGQTDEDGVCLRRWEQDIELRPVADNGHTLPGPGSSAEIELLLDLTGEQHGRELEATLTLDYNEQCVGQCWSEACDRWPPGTIEGTAMSARCPIPAVSGAAAATVSTRLVSPLKQLVGGAQGQLYFVARQGESGAIVDRDAGRIQGPNLTWIRDHPGIARLSCSRLLTGLSLPAPMSHVAACDRYLCGGHIGACEGNAECAAAWHCWNRCGRDSDCLRGCPAPGGDPGVWLALSQECCHDYFAGERDFPDASYQATCQLRLAVDYEIQPPQELCVGARGEEVCDGCDNDHDGQVDESFPGLGSACGTAEGACEPGTLACRNGAEVCVGGVQPHPEPDACDGRDDDCDGETDEGVREPCLSPCGPGTRPCGPGGCESDDCPTFCDTPGLRVCREQTRIYGACYYPDLPADVCDGLDNDCDGETDEGYELAGLPCGTELGLCTRGTWTCVDGEEVCEGAVEATQEICDGEDNDCDGVPDEAEDTEGCPCDEDGAEQPCGHTTGECQPGIRRCLAGVWGDCEGWAGPTAELCDGLDNDCDGETDEQPELSGPAPLGQPCGESQGECAAGVWTCAAGALECVGAVGPGEEVCDGLDNDCDGGIDTGPGLRCPPASSCAAPDSSYYRSGDTTTGFTAHEASCAAARGGRDGVRVLHELHVHPLVGGDEGVRLKASVFVQAFGGWSPVVSLGQGGCWDGQPVGCARGCAGQPGRACLTDVALPSLEPLFIFVDGDTPEDFGPYHVSVHFGLHDDPAVLTPTWCDSRAHLVSLRQEAEELMIEHEPGRPTPTWVYRGTTEGAPDTLQLGCGSANAGEVIFVLDTGRRWRWTVSTEHPDTEIDTVIAVRQPCTDVASEVCNDDSGEGTSSELDAVLGSDAGYDSWPAYIVVEGKDGQAGRFVLSVWER